MNINIKYTTKTILVLLSAFVFSPLYAADGDVFTAKTVEGIDMTFKVISEADKTCQVGGDAEYKSAIDKTTNGAITIPSNVNGYSVTNIGDDAFYNCNSLTSITIPNSVTNIGSSAFSACNSLTSITIPNSVTSIGKHAFSDCSGLMSITIPNSVTTIGEMAFINCNSLTSIKVDGNNKVYDSRDNCNAIIKTASNTLIAGCMSTIIPNSVISIADLAFYGCSGLTSITIPNSVTSIKELAFAHCSGLTSLTIPSRVYSIENYAFYGCSGLTNIVSYIADLFAIDDDVFPSSTKTDATLSVPYGMKVQYEQTDGWKEFVNIVETELSYKDGDVFMAKTAEDVDMLFKVISEEEKTCQVGVGRKDDGGYRMALSDLVRGALTIPSRVNGYFVTRIGEKAFQDQNGLTSITIPNSVTSIGYEAFYHCSGLTSITIPNSVTSIDFDAFAGCSGLTSITIPNSVTSIGNGAFAGCSGLTSITIPNSVTSIADYAFYSCSGLTSIISYIKEPFKITDDVFPSSIKTNATLSVPSGKKKLYKQTYGWMDFTNIVERVPMEVGDVFTAKTDEETDMCFMVTDIEPKSCQVTCDVGSKPTVDISTEGILTIPSSAEGFTVTSIGDCAFAGCKGLTIITIPNSVTSIGEKAFWDCNGLMTVISYLKEPFAINDNVFPSSTKTNATLSVPYGRKALYEQTDGWKDFANIVERETMDVGDVFTAKTDEDIDMTFVVTNVEGNTCRVTSGLDSETAIGITTEGAMTIPSIVKGYTVTEIDKAAFKGCESLTSIFIPRTITAIGDEAFVGCSGLASIVVDSENKVYDSRDNCNAIIETATNTLMVGCKNTVIPNTVTAIKDLAFYGCSGLTSITIPNSVTNIGKDAFAGCRGLTSIAVESNNQVYDSRDNCNAIIETATNTLLIGCQNTVIPSTVTAIVERACCGVLGLTAITLPATLRSIGEEAFANTDNLAHVTSEITEPFAIPATAFVHSNGQAPTLYVPWGTKEKYQSAEGWSQFKQMIEIASEGTEFTVDVNGMKLDFKVTDREKHTCQLGLGLPNASLGTAVHVTIPTEVRDQTVTAVSDYAFANCSELLSLTLPESIEMVGEHALDGCNSLAAIQWKAEKTIPASLTAGISNPNLLLYVKNKDYAPATIQNVVVNGVAENIVLKEAANGNNFYCMEGFTAKNITFTHNYSMTSGYKVCQGWETIALPFDVTSINHESYAEIIPITTWEVGSSKRPFWLYEQTTTGWKKATAIKANTPYILCLPNNTQYDPLYCVTGNVIFKGTDVEVLASSQLTKTKYGDRTFVPNFVNKNAASGLYALNVNNEWDKYDYTTYLQGSAFLPNLRNVHPFEAYMTMEGGVAAPEFIPVFENETTGISDAIWLNDKSEMANEKWYTLDGRKLQQQPERKGLYIVNGCKIVIK